MATSSKRRYSGSDPTIVPMANPLSANPFTERLQTRWLLFAVIIGLWVVVTIVELGLGLEIATNQPLMLALNGVFWILVCLVAIGKLQIAGGKLPAVIGRWPRDGRGRLSMVLVIPVLLFSLGSGQLTFVALARWQPDFVLHLLQSQVDLPQPSDSGWFMATSVLAIAIVAPITEEFLFRGIFLNRWGAKWGLQRALFLNALIFGILHINNPVGLSMFGLVISVVYIQTGSLWLAIAFHALNNSLALALGFISPPPTTDPEAILASIRNDWGFGLVCVAISTPLLLLYVSRNWPSSKTRLPYLNNLAALTNFAGRNGKPSRN